MTLISIDKKENDFYKLDFRINRVSFCLVSKSKTSSAAIKNNLTRIIKLRSAIRESRPDVVVSFIDRMNVLTLIATR